jgi:hypothetical protein
LGSPASARGTKKKVLIYLFYFLTFLHLPKFNPQTRASPSFFVVRNRGRNPLAFFAFYRTLSLSIFLQVIESTGGKNFFIFSYKSY